MFIYIGGIDVGWFGIVVGVDVDVGKYFIGQV